MGAGSKHQVSFPIFELDGHKEDSCPWVYSRCKRPNCNGIMRLLISKTLKNPNRKVKRKLGLQVLQAAMDVKGQVTG
ncbi:hypothetical protein GIB67_019415 [Kingdonia uniflora]|uniref:Uncharacterized protein n=1 Tax=Kingdonia uniflora TaxID=39325 RepID=A0A7J7MBC4_9MAGN|nr:hypothetical protein GIB67_019415 [Kingdonia uniflora]